MKIVFGLLLTILIGIGCRVIDIPVPAPPAMTGALLVLAMTIGYLAVDRWFPHRRCDNRKNCAGPIGHVPKAGE